MKKLLYILLLFWTLSLPKAQISLFEGFEGYLNPWANPEMIGPYFTSSEEIYCEGSQGSGALLSSLLGNMGVGPKTMTSPTPILGNNGKTLHINFSVVIGQVNLTDFETLEAIPAGVDWGYLKLQYSADMGSSWNEIEQFESWNFISKTDCTELSISIPAEEMQTVPGGILLRFVANRSDSFPGILLFVIDGLSLEQEKDLAVHEPAKNSLLIYPNPVKDILHLNAKNVTNIEIYSVAGQKLKTLERGTQLNVSDLAKGMYILKARVDGKPASTKFIKE